MKSGKRAGYLVVLLAALAACDGQDSQARKTQLLAMKLAQIAGQANGAAPAAVDPDTRLDGAKAGPGLMLTTTYTLVNAEPNGVTSATFEEKKAPTIKQAACGNPDLRPLIDQGAVVVLEYRGNQGNPLGTVRLDRDACRAAEQNGAAAPAN